MSVVVRRYYRYPHNNYYFFLYTPLVLALFGAAASLFLCSFLKCFFILLYIRRGKLKYGACSVVYGMYKKEKE